MKILLVPGFMLDHDLWSGMRPGLEAVCQTVDVDTSRDNSIEAIARRALSETDGPVVVIGFSMGGYVAREIAYQAPERVKGLALIATSSEGDKPSLSIARSGAGNITRSFVRLRCGAVAKSLSPAHRTDAMIERVQRMSERLGAGVLERQSQIHREGDVARLSEISCPTIVVAAGEDELRTIAESEALRDGIQGATFAVIEDAGHLIPLEQPESLVAALSPLLKLIQQKRLSQVG